MAVGILPAEVQTVNVHRGPKRKDISGRRHGHLVPIRDVGLHKGSRAWLCRCDCGKELILTSATLSGRNATSCGCAAPRRNEPMMGRKFGLLTVVGNRADISKPRLWVCKCLCGRTIERRTTPLVIGYNLSCGCSRHIRRTRPIIASQRKLFYSYQRDAKRRRGGQGLEFALTFERFIELTSSRCDYCDCEPGMTVEQYTRFNGHYKYNGIDRVDASMGYVEGNCVPCCRACNWMKNKMPRAVFLNHIASIYRKSIANDRGGSIAADEVPRSAPTRHLARRRNPSQNNECLFVGL